jgi:hypothetical protein
VLETTVVDSMAACDMGQIALSDNLILKVDRYHPAFDLTGGGEVQYLKYLNYNEQTHQSI